MTKADSRMQEDSAERDIGRGKTPWWEPTYHQDRRAVLLARNRIKAALRAWFEGEGFIEVDTACLQMSPGNETHLHAFSTTYQAENGAETTYHLHTSPEFACKKLLAAGEMRLFTFAPCFRNAERGRLHSPEFTMLEWYRVGESYERLMVDCKEILGLAAKAARRFDVEWDGRASDLASQPVRTTLQQAFERYARIDLRSVAPNGKPNLDAMRRATDAAGVRVSADDTWSDLFSRVLAIRIEPNLGHPAPEFLTAYPISEAALARPTAHDPTVAERFELYVSGVELANAFGELTDPQEQRRRFEADMAEKERIYGRRYPIDEDFLAALATMPAAAGAALGFDRLVMLATGAPHIDHVLWTPVAPPAVR